MRFQRMTAGLLAVMILMLSMAFVSCGTDEYRPSDDGVLKVVCTVFPALDFALSIIEGASEVSDGMIEIYLLGKAGQDMHSYEPTAEDILTISQADVFVHVGGESDKWVEATLRAANNQDLRVVSMMDVCQLLEEEMHTHAEDESCGLDHDHDAGEEPVYDEHVWVSLRNASHIVEAMGREMIAAETDESLKTLFEKNIKSYQEKLAELDGRYTAAVRASAHKTVVIADRNPFAYLMNDYGLDCYAAFPGCSSETQASFATQIELIATVKEHALPYVFIIAGSAGTVAQTVSEQTGAGVLELLSGQVVTDADREAGMTYLTIAEKNLENLKKALSAGE